jgi:hypothetical protein
MCPALLDFGKGQKAYFHQSRRSVLWKESDPQAKRLISAIADMGQFGA